MSTAFQLSQAEGCYVWILELGLYPTCHSPDRGLSSVNVGFLICRAVAYA